jgi:hypothetical protein
VNFFVKIAKIKKKKSVGAWLAVDSAGTHTRTRRPPYAVAFRLSGAGGCWSPVPAHARLACGAAVVTETRRDDEQARDAASYMMTRCMQWLDRSWNRIGRSEEELDGSSRDGCGQQPKMSWIPRRRCGLWPSRARACRNHGPPRRCGAATGIRAACEGWKNRQHRYLYAARGVIRLGVRRGLACESSSQIASYREIRSDDATGPSASFDYKKNWSEVQFSFTNFLGVSSRFINF